MVEVMMLEMVVVMVNDGGGDVGDGGGDGY
jgi:hypothetical protein